MASFDFVNTSQFRPFSYQEILQPLAAYTQEYNAIEEGLGELGTKADVFKSLASQQNDPETYQAYMNYANELNSVANDLSNHGLNASSRRKLVDMKRRYSSDIIPMEQAFNRRKELIDEQRKARLQDDSLRYESEASTISLDDLIKDPSLSYKSFSGKNIINISSKTAASIAKEARKDPRAWRQILDGQYYEAMIQKGASSEEVLAAMQGDVNANPRLRKIIDDAVSSSGVMDWKGVKDKDGNLTEYGKDLLNQVESYAGQGLWSAVGETTYKELANRGWAIPKETKNKSKLYYRAVPKTTVDGNKKTTELNDDLKFIKQLRANPKLLNKEEERHTQGHATQYGSVVGSGVFYKVKPNAEKLNQIIKKYDMKDGNMDLLEQKIQADIRSSAVRAFSYKPNITQSDLITQVLKENARSYNRRSGNTGIWKLKNNEKGKEIDIDDLNSYFTSDADIDFDPDLGFIINSTDKDDKTRSAVLDTELLDDQNRTLSRAQQAIKVALENGEDELATTLIEATMEAFYKRYNTLEKRQSNTFSKEG